MTLGELIKKYRDEHNMSMDSFSEKSGISKAYISLLEKNKHPKTGKPIAPSIQCIKQAASGMDIDFNDLFSVLDGDVSLENHSQETEFEFQSDTPIGIGHRIKEARERLGLTQTELGDTVGVTGSAITNYEKETSHPKSPILYKLIEALKVDANYLFQDCVNLPKEANDVTLSEYDHIKKYRALDPHGKKMVDFTLNEEWERSTAEQKPDGKVIPMAVQEDTDYLAVKAAHNDAEITDEELGKMERDILLIKEMAKRKKH